MANPSELERLDLMAEIKADGKAANREERESRWLRQGLCNTPEENRKANGGKGILNPWPR
jgi:hypothetical protein